MPLITRDYGEILCHHHATNAKFSLETLINSKALHQEQVRWAQGLHDFTTALVPSNNLMALQNFTTARKSGNILLTYLKLFSSDTRQSMKRRIVTTLRAN